ncbi:MAG: endonuclease/exonuclease/phosphatase family protein [Methylobacteriaceae bacterium]|nr:endonuclease/exonuclease/phosphatase family protein [Methylobacteriaceae bacterium]
MTIRIATFNVENLYSRFDFTGKVARERRIVGAYAIEDPQEYDLVRKSFEAVASDDMRQLTALAIADTQADIVCLQEVDSEDALNLFYEAYLRPVLRQRFGAATKGLDREQRDHVSPAWFYDWRRVVPGNDSRGIDVGVLSRFPVTVVSNANLTYEFVRELEPDWPALEALSASRDGRLFRRDCLEIEVATGGEPLTLFNCHFKSMQPLARGGDGRLDTMLLRRAEARGVRRIIERRFGVEGARRANWAICGDLNDFVAIEGVAAPGGALGPLLDDGFAVDPMTRLPPEERWTHYFAADDLYVQLDYLLLSPALAAASPAAPQVVRAGQPFRVPRLEGAPRYPRTGWARPKASDHCPVAMPLELSARYGAPPA